MEDQLRLSMAALEEENKRYKQLLQNAGEQKKLFIVFQTYGE